ncbi:MFS transporter [Saccharopolyspora pogona]|uniref:MFS transporter n=1 Tax=Saccharopolyspora pogona TaxID=333966 RepID=UPI0037C5D092
MVASRFVLRLAVGGASVTVPTYLAEISPAERRGRLVTQNELMIVSGQLLAFTFNAGIAAALGDSTHVWRWMLVVTTLPAVVLWFGMLVMPDAHQVNPTGRARELMMAVRVAVTDSAEGDVALRTAAAEAALRGTGLLVRSAPATRDQEDQSRARRGRTRCCSVLRKCTGGLSP